MPNIEASGLGNQPLQRKSGRKFLIFAVGVLIVAAIVVLLLLQKEQQKNPENIVKKTGVPEYFVLEGKTQVEEYKVTNPADYSLASGESLKTGVRYELNKSQQEAFRQVYDEMKAKGWIAIAGSGQNGDVSTLKMNNGTETIFIRFEGGKVTDPSQSQNAKTLVTILPVTK